MASAKERSDDHSYTWIVPGLTIGVLEGYHKNVRHLARVLDDPFKPETDADGTCSQYVVRVCWEGRKSSTELVPCRLCENLLEEKRSTRASRYQIVDRYAEKPSPQPAQKQNHSLETANINSAYNEASSAGRMDPSPHQKPSLNRKVVGYKRYLSVVHTKREKKMEEKGERKSVPHGKRRSVNEGKLDIRNEPCGHFSDEDSGPAVAQEMKEQHMKNGREDDPKIPAIQNIRFSPVVDCQQQGILFSQKPSGKNHIRGRLSTRAARRLAPRASVKRPLSSTPSTDHDGRKEGSRDTASVDRGALGVAVGRGGCDNSSEDEEQAFRTAWRTPRSRRG
jgi:hypothetical protein